MALFGPNTTGLQLVQSILHYKVKEQPLIVIEDMRTITNIVQKQATARLVGPE